VFTGGGGGWGSPLERPVDAVMADVKRGYVSVAVAADVYGVALDENTGLPDLEATARRRAELAATVGNQR
jgi:N-methylhydantoinase B